MAAYAAVSPLWDYAYLPRGVSPWESSLGDNHGITGPLKLEKSDKIIQSICQMD